MRAATASIILFCEASECAWAIDSDTRRSVTASPALRSLRAVCALSSSAASDGSSEEELSAAAARVDMKEATRALSSLGDVHTPAADGEPPPGEAPPPALDIRRKLWSHDTMYMGIQ